MKDLRGKLEIEEIYATLKDRSYSNKDRVETFQFLFHRQPTFIEVSNINERFIKKGPIHYVLQLSNIRIQRIAQAHLAKSKKFNVHTTKSIASSMYRRPITSKEISAIKEIVDEAKRRARAASASGQRSK